MKKFVILFTVNFFTILMSGQIQVTSPVMLATDQAKLNEIINEMNGKAFLEAFQDLNSFIQNYPNVGELYYLRAAARRNLNDFSGSVSDLKMAKGAGIKNNLDYIELMTSKEAMVQYLLKNLEHKADLDPKRNYRPVILPGDTIQGAMRPERSCYDVSFYNLTVKIIPDTKSIEGRNEIFFLTTRETRVIQVDLSPIYAINYIKWADRSLNYKRIEGGIFIDLGEMVPEGTSGKIEIEYNGTPLIARKPPWNGGFVWEKDKNKIHAGVACEHLGASSWWPVKDHLSDKPDSMTINLLVPKGYTGISNGNLVSHADTDGYYSSFKWHVSYPINTYNVTFYMGDFVNFNEKYNNGASSFDMDFYVLPKNLEKARKYYAQTREIISVFEKCFGSYPFPGDGVGMVEAPFEGMEHQGAIAIGGGYGKGNNRRDYWTKEYDYLLIHETAHEWWGNALAIGDMADAWINEGFGTYAECLFAEEKAGYEGYIKALAPQFSNILNLWPLVGERNINANTFLGGDIYHKGSAMLNNLRCIINNDTLFKNMIKSFFLKNVYKIVNTSDFVNHVHKYTNSDFTDFFNIFLYNAEPPVLLCSYTISKDNTLNFTYKWINTGKNFTMPFCIAVSDKEYIRLVGTTSQQSFRYENAKKFYLPNENRYNIEAIPPNSFTYYATSWLF